VRRRKEADDAPSRSRTDHQPARANGAPRLTGADPDSVQPRRPPTCVRAPGCAGRPEAWRGNVPVRGGGRSSWPPHRLSLTANL
jgi:hypothetical protein